MVSWEIDLFGRIGTAAAIAERQADMAAANAHAAMALVQGEAVRRYVQLRRYQAELALVAEEEQQLRLRRDQIAARVQGGVADRRHLNAADAELAKADAEREVLSVLIAQEKAALAVLVGSSPIAPDAQLAELLHANALPAVPESAVLVRPADLLARRPDVARADAALRAALGETVLAERAHLPRISLNLAAGLSAAAGGLGSTSAVRYAAGPLLQWDWLNSGRLAAREAAARAGDERAWHQFEQTVLAALEDSEGALGNWVAARSGFDKANDIERSLGEAARYAKARATAGLEAPVQYMDADLARVRAARNRVAGQNDALLAYARVQLALAAWQPDD
jgi:outer membrane protein TolC